MNSCDGCIFFTTTQQAVNEGDQILGTCRRYPQAVSTYSNNWCGEFKTPEPA